MRLSPTLLRALAAAPAHCRTPLPPLSSLLRPQSRLRGHSKGAPLCSLAQQQQQQQAPTSSEAGDPPMHGIAVGGHRGHGSNVCANNMGQLHPSYRENTLLSCKAAVDAGATFIEFDLQVTKDGVVVLWHDDEVIFTGSQGAPVHCKVADLTLAEFKSLVCGAAADSEGRSTQRRTPLLRQFDGVKGFIPTASLLPWIVAIDDELPTLDTIFSGLPESVGLNLEVKMTTPDSLAVTPPDEVERVVRPVLECVERHTGFGRTSSRGIAFSSFDPDVCVALKAHEQNSYPVLFLSECGASPHADARRTSIEAAISHAASSRLSGIVAPASVLLANKSMVTAAQAANLAVLTYGVENNEPENVREQAELGVRGAILDEVRHVVSSLQLQSAPPSTSTYVVDRLDVGIPVSPLAAGRSSPTPVRVQ